MKLQKLTRARLADQVAETIYEKILRGELLPGERLPCEMELSEQLGVGRPTVREAMSRLIGIGLIRRESYYMYVSETPDECIRSGLVPLILDEWEIRELYEARILIECDLLSLAIQKATPEDIQRLREINERLNAENLTAESYWESDMAFHNAIADISGNEVMRLIGDLLNGLFKRYEPNIQTLKEVQADTYATHAALITAIEQCELETAKELVAKALHGSEAGLYKMKNKPM